jgi:hypothetical protein
MAKKPKTGSLQKVTLNLYHGDFARLQRMYGHSNGGTIVRELVRTHIASKKQTKDKKDGE